MALTPEVEDDPRIHFTKQFLNHVVGESGRDDREGLKETPRRVVDAWAEYTAGYDVDPKAVLKAFEDGAKDYDELLIETNIPVWSTCEHHLAPFWGLAHVGYIPKGKVIGLSKFARLVDVFGRRLQVQERMTVQIADTIMEVLEPEAVGVVIQCRHMCMESRGVKTRGCVTTTAALRGGLKTNASLRDEFYDLIKLGQNGVTI